VELLGQTDGWSRLEATAPPGAPLAEFLGRLAVERSWAVRELRDVRFTLEQTFMAHTRDEEEVS